MTNTKKHGVKLDTLKECFQFLDWLHTQKNKQQEVVNRLLRRLKPYYESMKLSEESVKSSLSDFLYQVSHFYRKLCHTLIKVEYKTKTAKQLLDALLHCKPKLLAALHFLWYNVDDTFALAGGGTWKNDKVAQHSSDVSKIDAYLIAKRSDGYGVIPGGFEAGELKEGHKDGYSDGSVMAPNLEKILGTLLNNFFSDVFVTSVSSTAGSQASNTANSLALLKIFSDIVDGDGNNEIEQALDGDFDKDGYCIEWEKLKAHCTELKEYLGHIFDAGLLSYTGNSSNVSMLNKGKFARKMTRWLRENLDKVGGSLKNIKTDRYTGASDYFNEHFFPYGFIFDTHGFDTNTHSSGELKQKWVKVIEMLSSYGKGLDETVNILKGRQCYPSHRHNVYPEGADDEEEEDEDDEDEDDEDEDDDDDGTSNQNNGQSEQTHESSQILLGSNVPPEDGKNHGPAGPPGDGGGGSQDSGPPSQQPVPPQAAAHTSSTNTPSPSHPVSGGSDTDSAPGAPGSNGDQGQLGPAGPVASASSDFSDAQVIQPPQPTLQSSAMSTPTPPASPTGSPVFTYKQGVLGGDSQDASLGSQHTHSSKAVLTQATSVSGPPPAAPGGLDPSSGQGQDLPKLEVKILKPKLIYSEDAYNSSADALISDHIERSRYRNGINPPRDPLTVSHTLGKASPQSDIASDLDKLQEASVLSNSLDLRDVDMPFEHFDFHVSPNEGITGEAYIPQCRSPWSLPTFSTAPTAPTLSPPVTDHLPPPRTVREMLYWLVGLNQYGYIEVITEHVKSILKDINTDVSKSPYGIDVTRDPGQLTASLVTAKVTEACLYSAIVIYRITYRDEYTNYEDFKFESVYSKFRYSLDPACLFCQLRDYAYACHHQLEFLKSQCNRDKSHGGWQNFHYGSDVSCLDSPLQAFLTDAYNSMFKTQPYDPCNICLKSRVDVGFKASDLPSSRKTGSMLNSYLYPSCGDDDPLLTLSAYLTCLTKRTPRTTGELVSFFQHFGKSLYDFDQMKLSLLGNSLLSQHPNCPGWDHLDDTDLQDVRGVGGYESIKYISNHKHDHPNTLSTLVGCSGDRANCPQHCSPITYRAYALYSQSFAHTYLSWTVHLADRLWESLDRLSYDLEGHVNVKCPPLHSCPYAMPLLYLHGFTPPEGALQSSLTCSDIITKLKAVVDGKPIATLMTAMDDFLYNIRMPFIYTLIAFWSVAALLLSYTILYRLDVLYLCSHFIRSKASHLIDVKALLTNSRKMLSLYDADYFDDDPNDLTDQLN